MYIYDFQIVLQEVPGEISLCFSISGCSIQCKGCHSPFSWKKDNGSILTKQYFLEQLKKYKVIATCVLFMGGEWHETELIENLELAKKAGYKTCLYTGQEKVSIQLKKQLTWLKTGKWNEHLGGLDSKNTNQKFIEVKTNKKLNHLFIKN
ncbi:anaerobic ribonucleoside-triphosphate reductase activating protein [uncultured Tenacibaculum sp.]|uniref:anaerobic ribonucleoside-triphosphate reductase activating protein n=1 Tax=uncultured Tenacibaculum sp. TaxID=174713 RepID=UPI002626378C|nr:anaerobic ribonucleoside-triphosphate reductase activating protein [uncultured Tenacibaculum sp.]